MDRDALRREIREKTELSYSRSGGPGGQNVNKRDTKVTARLELDLLEVPSPEEMSRLHRHLKNRLSTDGVLVLQAESTRSQSRNRVEALDRVEQLVATALRPDPRPRKPTRPSRAAKQRRLDAKKRRSGIKAARRKPGRGED